MFKTYAPEKESILKEADTIAHGDRQQAYGHPFDTYTRAAALVSAMLSHKLQSPLTAHDMALVMAQVKIAREIGCPRRDNRIDLAGFAWVADRIAEQDAHDFMQAQIEIVASTPDVPAFLRPDVPAGTREHVGNVRSSDGLRCTDLACWCQS